MQNSKSILKTFDGTNWRATWKHQFNQGTPCFLAGRKTASGRTHWEIIDNENPRVKGRQTVVTKVEAQQQRSVMLASDQQVGIVDQNGTAVCDTIANEVSTTE
jgi:hypothetical protein